MLTRSRQSSLEKSSKDPVSGKKIWFYYYEIEPHRDARLIKSVLEPRFWWKDKADLQTFSPEANLSWYVSHKPYNYDRLWAYDRDIKYIQMINRFQQGYELSEKDNLYRNLWFYHKTNIAELDAYVPTTYSFRLYESTFHVELQEFARFFLSEHKGVKPTEVAAVGDDLDANQKPMKVYHFFNTVLPFGQREKQFENKKADQVKKDPVLYGGKKANLWMIKPAWMRDGEGVEIFNSLDKLDEIISKYFEKLSKDENQTKLGRDKRSNLQNHSEGLPYGVDRFVIQKYIEKPLLYHGYKFDIKVFALYTQARDLYLFSESLVQLAAIPFDLEKLNYYAHMANPAISSQCSDFGSVVPGNVMTLKALEEHLAATFPATGGKADAKVFKKPELHDQIHKIVTRSFDATFDIIEKPKRDYNFELFSFDLMMDENLKLWLLEVNSGPSLEGTNEYSNLFMARMLDDAFKLTIDHHFWKSAGYTRDFMYPVHPLPPFHGNENLWKFFKSYQTSHPTLHANGSSNPGK